MTVGARSTSLDDVVGGLEAVSLDDLDRIASLHTRIDRKYLVELDVARALVEAFAPQLRALAVGGRRAFAYESLYFDTPDLASFRAAAHRRRHRFKVRTRVYVDRGERVLEVKTRDARGATVKRRLTHDTEVDIVGAAGAAFVDAHLDRPGLAATLRPTLRTTYRRRTLLDAAAGSRLTVDTDVVLAEQGGPTFALHDLAIVETKTMAGALDEDRWLWRRGVRATPLSKYCVGLALADPTLPRNRWRPVLRRLEGGAAEVPARATA